MESITNPQVINMPFCANGDKNTIPSAATGSQLASLEEGFPEITEKPIDDGGIPPERADFNGAMNLNSQFYFAFQNGWWPTFNADVSTAIGGYPLGAVLWWFPESGSYAGMAVPLKSLVANNTYNFNTNSSYIGTYWKPLYKDPNAMSIGTVFLHQSSNAADVPGALPLFTGETISNADQLYPDFYDWVEDHTELQISAANYEAALTAYGECPNYVIDTTNKTIRLPKLVNYVKMANSIDGITQNGAGLPNINAQFGGVSNGTDSGAVTSTQLGSFSGASSGGGPAQKTFDASLSSSIYGNSNTVTPAHTTLFPWVCAYNAAVAASTAQASEFQAALTSKADKTLANVTSAAGDNLNSVGVRTVIETYHNGSSWYRVWSDGWCEQGGTDTFSSTASRQSTINLLKAFNSTDYQIFLMGFGSAGAWGIRVSAQTDDSFTYNQSSASENYRGTKIFWRAEGYIN